MRRTVNNLRQQYPQFVYRSFDVEHRNGDLRFRFQFHSGHGIKFEPEVVIRDVPKESVDCCPPDVLRNLAFHLGLMEIPSYWKATASPQIVVEAGALNAEQISWLTNLLLRGMGEYFWVNGIDFTTRDFLTISSSNLTVVGNRDERPRFANRVLIPIGGGKDSAVTTEIIRGGRVDIDCMLLNPTKAALDCADVGGFTRKVIIERTIDPKLLQLNSEGYLNGHTPLSAYLAFLGVGAGILFGYGKVAVSNERSSNEGNVSYCNTDINHQFSKTFEFEESFRRYSQKYLSSDVEFFSFLRPLYELQIAQLFSKLIHYHHIFRSCNRGQKHNIWCGSCPKCLFVYAALYPFLPKDQIRVIFSEDLFQKRDLFPIALELLGAAETKPFECVGTHEENKVAFYLAGQKLRKQSQPLPPLLQLVEDRVLSREQDLEERAEHILSSWDGDHAIPEDLLGLLKDAALLAQPTSIMG